MQLRTCMKCWKIGKNNKLLSLAGFKHVQERQHVEDHNNMIPDFFKFQSKNQLWNYAAIRY